MAMRENERLVKFVQVAFEETSIEVLGQMSQSDEVRLRQLLQIAGATRIPTWDAPASLQSAAAAIMPKRETRSMAARVLGSSIGLAGARAVETLDSFQVAYALDDETMRVLYEREQDGWRVLGRTGSATWSITAAGKEISPDQDGAFEFVARDLTETGMLVGRGDLEISIPSAMEVIEHGSPNND